jgi:hypothetical protein
MLPASPKLQQSSPLLVSHCVSLVQDLEHDAWQTPRSELPEEPASPFSSSSPESFSAQPLNKEKQSASEPAALKNLSIIEVIALSPKSRFPEKPRYPADPGSRAPDTKRSNLTRAFPGV